jgi:hypothetical protein
VAVTTTVKAVSVAGNDLVLVFKRPGVGEFERRPEDDPKWTPWA